MNDGLSFAMWLVGSLGTIGLAVAIIARAIARDDAQSSLENRMQMGSVEAVRSLLIARGHLLRKDVRDAAQVWLVEHDNRKDG